MNWKSEEDVKRVQVILEEYKAFIGDLGNVGNRLTSAQTLYLSVLGTTVALLSVTSGENAAFRLGAEGLWILAGFGWVVCLLWWATTDFHLKLFGAIFRTLQVMERELPAQPYTEQGKFISTRRVYLTRIQSLIPIAFAILIGLLAVFGHWAT